MTHCITSLKSKDSRGDRKKKGVGKGGKGSEATTQTKQNRRECDYTDEASNESVESLNIGSQNRIQIFKEAPANGSQHQLTKG